MDKSLIEKIKKIENNIALIIPAYEPNENLLILLKQIRQDYAGTIVVINDGSGSEYSSYYEIAKETYRCDVLTHYANMGKGRALKNAFNHCLNTYSDMIGCVTADSDGQHLPEDIFRCMSELYDNQHSLIMGCRDFSLDDVPTRSKIGNNFMKVMCRYTCGVKTADTQTGLRGIPRDFMRDLLNTTGERFEFETWMLIDAKNKYPIHDITIQTVYESKENHQSHYNTVRDSYRIGKIFAKIFIKFLLSSLSSTVVDLLIFNALCPIMRPISALYYITLSTAIARVISATYNYLINYKLVFKSSETHTKSAAKYFLLALVQMGCSAVLTTIGVMLLSASNETAVKAFVDVCLFFISYGIQRAFVFK